MNIEVATLMNNEGRELSGNFRFPDSSLWIIEL